MRRSAPTRPRPSRLANSRYCCRTQRASTARQTEWVTGFYGTCDWLQIRLRRSAFPSTSVGSALGDIVRNTASVSPLKTARIGPFDGEDFATQTLRFLSFAIHLNNI